MKCEGSSCLPDIYASHLFLVVPPAGRVDGFGRGLPAPLPPSRVRGVRGASRRTAGRRAGAGHSSRCPVNAFAQLYRPSVSRSGSGIAVGGTHTHTYIHTYTHTWDGSLCGLLLSRAFAGRRRIGWPCCMAFIVLRERCPASASLAPCLFVRTETMGHLPLAEAYPERDTTGMYFK